jgi:hypothetical protein
MKRFTAEIDLKLEALANKLSAKVSKNRPGQPESLRTFEERRIDWIDIDINKAIIFQPNFELEGVNEDKWNFLIAAWHFEGPVHLRFTRYLVKEKPFNLVANQLTELLIAAVEHLSTIDMIELKKLNNLHKKDRL